jgi:hypothetical protein
MSDQPDTLPRAAHRIPSKLGVPYHAASPAALGRATLGGSAASAAPSDKAADRHDRVAGGSTARDWRAETVEIDARSVTLADGTRISFAAVAKPATVDD